ncbi:hypothetical protein RI367_005369 [Sorochytrium milnesiophthora]
MTDNPQINSDSVDAYQRYGPKHGVYLTQEAAERIFGEEHLVSFVASSKGYNNRIYLAKARDGGREYVVKICGRFWTRRKTQCEVVGLALMHKYGAGAVPVPRLTHWCSDKSVVGVEYVVMERVRGVCLGDAVVDDKTVWALMTPEQRKRVVRQIAHIVGKMKTCIPPTALPPAPSTIGNLQLADGVDSSSSQDGNTDVVDKARVHQTLDGDGPWHSYADYMSTQTRAAIDKLNSDGMAVLKPMRDQLSGRIEAFYKQEYASPTSLANTGDVRLAFTHGDLNLRNIMVRFSSPAAPARATAGDDAADPLAASSKQVHDLLSSGAQVDVSAVLDWEWAGMFPEYHEYVSSFEFLDEDIAPGIAELDELRDLMYGILENEYGVGTPRTIVHYQHFCDLTDVQEAIAPWYMTDLVDTLSEKAQNDVQACITTLSALLEKFGC